MANRTAYQDSPPTASDSFSDLDYGSLEDPRTTIYQWLVLNIEGPIQYQVLGRNRELTGPGQYSKGPWYTIVGDPSAEDGPTLEIGSHVIAVPVVADEAKLVIKASDAYAVRISGRCIFGTYNEASVSLIYSNLVP